MTHPLRAAIVAAEAEVRRLSAERDSALVEAVVWDGMTQAEAAEVFGLSQQRVSQLVRRERAAMLATVRPETAAQRLENAREACRVAQYAQDLRAEAESGGNAAELRAFYADPDESPADVTEAPIRWRLTDWHESESAYLRALETEQLRGAS